MTSKTPQLTYGLTPTPFPLVAGASRRLTLSAANHSARTVEVSWLRLDLGAILVGGGATTTPEAPEGWRLSHDKSQLGRGRFLFEPDTVPIKVGDEPLLFRFDDVQISSEAGPVQVTITERSFPPPSKVGHILITKFPADWGAVDFWADPYDVPYPGKTTLHWRGPTSANYKLRFHTARDGIVYLPKDRDDPSLGASGVYPLEADVDGFTLDQTTVFSLTVSEIISGRPFHATKQVTVTVEPPPPNIIRFEADPATVDPGNPRGIELRWETEHVGALQVHGVGEFEHAEARRGSCTIRPRASATYLATAYPLPGHPGPPATSSASVEFVGSVSSGYLDVWGQPDMAGKALGAIILAGRKVFDLMLDIEGSGREARFETWTLSLALADSVEVADLGTAGGRAGFSDVVAGKYTSTLPRAKIWIGRGVMHLRDDIFSEQPENIGATWGVRFGDGDRCLLWYHSASPERPGQYTGKWSFVFGWKAYGPPVGTP